MDWFLTIGKKMMYLELTVIQYISHYKRIKPKTTKIIKTYKTVVKLASSRKIINSLNW